MRAAVLIVSLTVVACAEGITPPAITEMVEIRDGLTYVFGRTDFCAPPNTAAALRPNCNTPIPGGFALVPPPVEVTVQPFAIDVHEVTNLQYLHCVATGGCTDLAGYNGVTSEQREYYDTDRFAQFPVNQVSWNQAKAYCEHVGKRLPTEVEWERVARGNIDAGVDRLYLADGITELNGCQANSGDGFATQYCRGNENFIAVTDTSSDFVTENGQRIYGLLGNVAEWTDTWAQTEMGCKADPPCPQERDCAVGDNACITNSKDCPACTTPDSCYYMCDAEPDGLPLKTIVCTPFTDAEQPVAQDAILPDGGTQKIIRGGSVKTNEAASCRLRSSRPNDKLGMFALDVTRTEPGIGFRCAKSL